MGEVEKSAEAEAEKKGITGKARRDYIGGAFHRIMAHHEGKVKEQREKRAEHKPKAKKEPLPWYGSEENMQKLLKERADKKKQEERARIEQTIKDSEWYFKKGLQDYQMSGKSRKEYIASHEKTIAEAKQKLKELEP